MSDNDSEKPVLVSQGANDQADRVSKDDPQKTQKLAKAGDDIDPNAGQE
jgi:hypothetical protein